MSISSDQTTELVIRLNGVLSAFQREPGCACPRCTDPDERQRNNTSASIILRQDGEALEHHLIDAGQGVVDEMNRFGGPWPLDSIALTHGHFDHVAGIDWLANALVRARKSGQYPQQRVPLPVHCTRGTWEVGPHGFFPYLTPDNRSRRKIEHRLVQAGETFVPGAYPGLTLTPLPVVHYHDSVVYVLQFWRGENWREADAPPDARIVFCWDMLRFPRAGDTRTTAGHDFQPGFDASHPLLQRPDLLFIESNTRNPRPKTGHTSVQEVEPLIRMWQPKQARIVHYSGHEDAPKGILDLTNRDARLGPVAAEALNGEIQEWLGNDVAMGYVGEQFCFE